MTSKAASSSSTTNARNGAHPYARPPAKAHRQQFSACGSCRHRRVKCDLKDTPVVDGQPPVCSNCAERGIRCVDEYADVKAVKNLRRGRRIQEVERMYGHPPPDPSGHGSGRSSSPQESIIPHLQPEFFTKPFYRRFHIQRPIVDPTEFSARFLEFLQGKPDSLGATGHLIASVLVTWAYSYGVDEYGHEEPDGGVDAVNRRRLQVNAMVRELLDRIDKLGVMRKPSWDGVRVLLLIMPLTEDVQTPMDRLNMYQSTVTQIYTLCSVGSMAVRSTQGEFVDALVRARIFWYGHCHEGITSGLRGRKLIFDNDDLRSFQESLPNAFATTFSAQALQKSPFALTYTYRYATAPIRCSSACRQINAALTGAKARSRPDVDEEALRQAWEALEMCWEEFEGLRVLPPAGIITAEDTDRFVSGWQVFLFECHNVIRETLKKRMVEQRGGSPTTGAYVVDADANLQVHLATTTRLHSIAQDKCHDMARHVLSIVRRQLGTSFFKYDASLVRDGTLYAGNWAANESSEDDVKVCIQALSEMRWAYSLNETRIENLKWAWEQRQLSTSHGHQSRSPPSPPSGGAGPSTPPGMAIHSHTPHPYVPDSGTGGGPVRNVPNVFLSHTFPTMSGGASTSMAGGRTTTGMDVGSTDHWQSRSMPSGRTNGDLHASSSPHGSHSPSSVGSPHSVTGVPSGGSSAPILPPPPNMNPLSHLLLPNPVDGPNQYSQSLPPLAPQPLDTSDVYFIQQNYPGSTTPSSGSHPSSSIPFYHAATRAAFFHPSDVAGEGGDPTVPEHQGSRANNSSTSGADLWDYSSYS